MTGTRYMRRLGLAICLLLAISDTQARDQNGRPVFRGGVDVLSIDVQVVNSGGHPITGLGADAFSVTIAGRSRRVVSAELVSVHAPAKAPPVMIPPSAN